MSSTPSVMEAELLDLVKGLVRHQQSTIDGQAEMVRSLLTAQALNMATSSVVVTTEPMSKAYVY